MEKDIYQICSQLNDGQITVFEATENIINLLNNNSNTYYIKNKR